MMDAARCGNPADAEEAIQLGADLTASDDHGMTALHYAAARGSMGIVKLLIKFGAPLDAVDSTGMSPLHSAVIHDRTAVVSKLLAAACSVDLLDARGFTPLHHAASTGQLAMVRLLVEAGCASLQIKTRLQLTPLLCAIEKRRCNTIRYLADAQKPPFVLPAEPSDFHPSCPNSSSTLMRFLKTLPPRPSQSIQNVSTYFPCLVILFQFSLSTCCPSELSSDALIPVHSFSGLTILDFGACRMRRFGQRWARELR